MTEFQRTAGISRHEHALDRNNIRPVFFDNFANGNKNSFEPVRKRALRGPDRAARDISGAVAGEIEYAESCQSRSGVDTKYASFFAQNCTLSAASKLLEHIVGDVGIAVYVLHIVNILEHFEQLDHGVRLFRFKR